jgi:hypothetical protein
MTKPHQSQLDPQIDAKVSQLRTLLMTAKDLDAVSEYFYDALVSDEAFMRSGEPGTNPRLLTALEAVLQTVAPEGKLGMPLIIRLREQAFCHGHTKWGRGHVVFFYFEQLDLGFCGYSQSLSSEQITFLRFTLTNPVGGIQSAWPSKSGARKGLH